MASLCKSLSYCTNVLGLPCVHLAFYPDGAGIPFPPNHSSGPHPSIISYMMTLWQTAQIQNLGPGKGRFHFDATGQSVIFDGFRCPRQDAVEGWINQLHLEALQAITRVSIGYTTASNQSTALGFRPKHSWPPKDIAWRSAWRAGSLQPGSCYRWTLKKPLSPINFKVVLLSCVVKPSEKRAMCVSAGYNTLATLIRGAGGDWQWRYI